LDSINTSDPWKIIQFGLSAAENAIASERHFDRLPVPISSVAASFLIAQLEIREVVHLKNLHPPLPLAQFRVIPRERSDADDEAFAGSDRGCYR
jgi:hypothetical protein